MKCRSFFIHPERWLSSPWWVIQENQVALSFASVCRGEPGLVAPGLDQPREASGSGSYDP